MKSRALGQPASDERSLVGAVVIHDEMDRQGGGDSGIDRVEELSELKRTMPPVELAEDLAGLEIEGRKQRGRAVAFVVVGPTLDLARAHWQQRLRPIERLNLRLLVHAEHDRMLGRIHVQAHHVTHLVDQQRIGRQLERDRKSTRLNSSHVAISYAVFCLKKKKTNHTTKHSSHRRSTTRCACSSQAT